MCGEGVGVSGKDMCECESVEVVVHVYMSPVFLGGEGGDFGPFIRRNLVDSGTVFAQT